MRLNRRLWKPSAIASRRHSNPSSVLSVVTSMVCILLTVASVVVISQRIPNEPSQGITTPTDSAGTKSPQRPDASHTDADGNGTPEDADAPGGIAGDGMPSDATETGDGANPINAPPAEAAPSTRMMVRLPEGTSPRSEDTVIGKVGSMYLMECATQDAKDETERHYETVAEFVADDIGVDIATAEPERASEGIPSVRAEQANPFDALAGTTAADDVAYQADGSSFETDDANRPLVALLDTGAPMGESLAGSVSMLGDDGVDRNGHARLMLDTMHEQNPNVRVMSVKVLDDAGHGTASSVYAGIIYAVDNGAKILNLSFAGADTTGNQAIREAVQYALDRGVVVMAAAGNGGYDAGLVTPANVDGAFTVGAADKNGEVLANSNRGTCVDAFVEATSTSVAAAKVSGQVSLGLDGWRERVSEKLGVNDGEIEAPIETMLVGDGVRASASRTITFDAGEGTFDGGGKTNQIAYVEFDLATKYAHTSNISDAGVRSGNYPNSQQDKQVVQIPGATSLHVRLSYGTEYYYDQVFVIEGEYAGSVSNSMNVTGQLGMYQGGYSTPSTVEFDVDGDTVTFAFYSNGSSSYYGYYAVVTGVPIEVTGSYKEPVAPSGSCFWHWVNESGQVVKWQDCTTTQTLTAVYGSTETHFMSNGGTGAMADLSLVPGVTAPYGLFTGSSDKPYFAYWTTAADGSGTRYDVGDELPYEADLTLYAQYVALEKTIAHAVLESDGTLTFFRSGASYENGSTGTFYDVNGVGRSGTLYTGFETVGYTSYSSVPWYDARTSVKSVRFAQEIKPTSTAYWFYGCSNLADFHSTNLNMSSVTSMNSMFYNCSDAAFNPDVSNWDTSKVTTMSYMFYNCSGAAFNPDVSDWDTSRVTGMSSMFYNCRSDSFNPDVSNWDTSSVLYISDMFYNCSGAMFNPDMSDWDISSVTNIQRMFYNCSGAAFNPDVSTWDTSSVTLMDYAFYRCSGVVFNPDVSDWDTSSVLYMSDMFYNCSGAAFNPDVSDWDTSSVWYMSEMFYNCSGAAFNPDVSNWDTSKVTAMSYMFYNCSGAVFNPDMSDWDTSRVTTMSYMFYNCSGDAFNPDVSDWDTASVTSMVYMFYNCSGAAFTNIDLSGWDIGYVQSVSYMFYGCSKLTTIYAHPSADWNSLTQMTSSNSMFSGCSQLVGGAGTAYNSGKLNKAYARVDGLGGSPGYFTSRGTVPIRHYAILDSTGMFTFFNAEGDFSTGAGKTVTDVDGRARTGELFHVSMNSPDLNSLSWRNRSTSIKSVRFAQVTKPMSTAYWFSGCSNLADFDSTNLDTGNVTNMTSMFENCNNLTTLDASGWDTSNVTNMTSMFRKCRKLATLDVGSWDTGNVTNMTGMFAACTSSAFHPDINNWNTANVTNMREMFDGCVGMTIPPDVGNWNTANVTDMTYMFRDCKSMITPPDVSNWNTAKVTSMAYMFYMCSAMTTPPDVSNWNTANVSGMSWMFYGCSAMTTPPDVGNWNTANVSGMGYMFNGCNAMTSLDVSGWDFSKIASTSSYLGLSCRDLKRLIVPVGAKIASVPEHAEQGKYLSTWRNESLGVVGRSSADMVTMINAGNGAGTWEWETGYAVTFKTGNTTMGTQTVATGTATALTTVTGLSNAPVSSSHGWSFSGWATSPNTATTTYSDGAEITATDDITLYAVYSRSITFKHYGSATATSVTTATQTQHYYNTSETTVDTEAVLTCALYTHSTYGWEPLGWVTSPAEVSLVSVSQTGTALVTVNPSADSSLLTYYAVYQRDARMAYAPGGGTGAAPADSTCSQRGNASGQVTAGVLMLAPNTFARGGYAFDGWYVGGTAHNPGDTYPWAPAFDAIPTIQATATWVPVELSGTLDSGNPDADHDGYGDNIAFSVPLSVNYVVKADGTLLGPSNVAIRNHGSFEIRVSSLDADAVPPFSLVPAATGISNACDIAIGPQGSEVSVADYKTKALLPDTSAWHVPAASGTTPGSLPLSTSGHAGPLTTDLLTATDFATIQWYVKPT